ncbi:MAG: UDP-3-O-acyl-N-acetylglucosamine deacetylase [Proteobacteria bacterium]|nr:UDP-3-O-acyl-N-acetylglucosamine deacetylase [Pseudomonadota bacterium]
MQKTVAKKVVLSGHGLHSGKPARLVICPASAEYGIWFRRVDITDTNNLVPALYDSVNDTQMCTRLANEGGVEVSTVEHLMAALAGTGIQNALIEIDGPEVPIMDGSSAPFVRAILAAGVQSQDAPIRAIRILKEVSIQFDDTIATLQPSDTFEIDFFIDFDDAAIGKQQKTLEMTNGAFVHELSDCRTFCMRKDVEAMQAIGLAQGGGLDNAIVIDNGMVLNPDGLRRTDEFVRHKMLDALGDLALAGAPILGKYTGIKAGHRATNMLLHELFSTPGAWEMVVCDTLQNEMLPGARIQAEEFALSA